MSEKFDISSVPADVYALARAVRERFIEAKKTALGITKPWKLGERYDRMQFFVNAAYLIKNELNANPADFIRALFEFHARKEGPLSNQIYGAHARNLWATYKKTYATHFERITGTDAWQQDKDAPDFVPPQPFDVPITLATECEDQWMLASARLGPDPDIKNPETLEHFRDTSAHMKPWFRLFVYPYDPVIWREFSWPGRQTLSRNPDLVTYLRSLNPAHMAFIMQAPVAPKPEWLFYDKSYD